MSIILFFSVRCITTISLYFIYFFYRKTNTYMMDKICIYMHSSPSLFRSLSPLLCLFSVVVVLFLFFSFFFSLFGLYSALKKSYSPKKSLAKKKTEQKLTYRQIISQNILSSFSLYLHFLIFFSISSSYIFLHPEFQIVPCARTRRFRGTTQKFVLL